MLLVGENQWREGKWDYGFLVGERGWLLDGEDDENNLIFVQKGF